MHETLYPTKAHGAVMLPGQDSCAVVSPSSRSLRGGGTPRNLESWSLLWKPPLLSPPSSLSFFSAGRDGVTPEQLLQASQGGNGGGGKGESISDRNTCCQAILSIQRPPMLRHSSCGQDATEKARTSKLYSTQAAFQFDPDWRMLPHDPETKRIIQPDSILVTTTTATDDREFSSFSSSSSFSSPSTRSIGRRNGLHRSQSETLTAVVSQLPPWKSGHGSGPFGRDHPNNSPNDHHDFLEDTKNMHKNMIRHVEMVAAKDRILPFTDTTGAWITNWNQALTVLHQFLQTPNKDDDDDGNNDRAASPLLESPVATSTEHCTTTATTNAARMPWSSLETASETNDSRMLSQPRVCFPMRQQGAVPPPPPPTITSPTTERRDMVPRVDPQAAQIGPQQSNGKEGVAMRQSNGKEGAAMSKMVALEGVTCSHPPTIILVPNDAGCLPKSNPTNTVDNDEPVADTQLPNCESSLNIPGEIFVPCVTTEAVQSSPLLSCKEESGLSPCVAAAAAVHNVEYDQSFDAKSTSSTRTIATSSESTLVSSGASSNINHDSRSVALAYYESEYAGSANGTSTNSHKSMANSSSTATFLTDSSASSKDRDVGLMAKEDDSAYFGNLSADDNCDNTSHCKAAQDDRGSIASDDIMHVPRVEHSRQTEKSKVLLMPFVPSTLLQEEEICCAFRQLEMTTPTPAPSMPSSIGDDDDDGCVGDDDANADDSEPMSSKKYDADHSGDGEDDDSRGDDWSL
ncbi:hypothetical protein ACA910_015733 [Epithemia clementina (nom. ined.)]